VTQNRNRKAEKERREEKRPKRDKERKKRNRETVKMIDQKRGKTEIKTEKRKEMRK
jgi:hypothetical protein